jgi:hypothetical protein
LDVILVFFAALVARDSQSLAELAEKSDLIDTLFSMLLSTSPEKDFLSLLSAGANDAELKKAGIVSKIERGLVRFPDPQLGPVIHSQSL